MLASTLRSWTVCSIFLTTLIGSEAHGITLQITALPATPHNVTTPIANRAKAEVAIRRIKSLLIVEKGQNDDTFEALSRAQQDLQGRR
jgi:hypothetical protein